MKCVTCDKNSYLGLTLLNNKYICFNCVMELRNFQFYAPNPYQEQPANYFPKIGA